MVSRPAVSRALRELEAEFDIDFFTRTPTGIFLTEAGQKFYEKCSSIQRLLSELKSEMDAIKKMSQINNDRSLKIGLSPTAGYSVFPKFYPLFIEKHPDIIVEPQEMLATQSAIFLRQNKLDVSLALFFGDPEDDICFLDIGNMEFVFCCNKSHRLAGETSVSVEDISGEPIVQLDQALVKGYLVSDLYNKYGFTPNIKFRTSQLSMVFRMVENGMCSTIQFDGIVENNENIVAIPFKEPVVCPMRISWNPDIPHNSAFGDFMAFAKEHMVL